MTHNDALGQERVKNSKLWTFLVIGLKKVMTRVWKLYKTTHHHLVMMCTVIVCVVYYIYDISCCFMIIGAKHCLAFFCM